MSDTESISFHLTIYPPDCGTGQLRQIAPGFQPLVLLEPEMDEETEEVSFNVTLSLLDREEAADILEMTVDALRNGVDDGDDA